MFVCGVWGTIPPPYLSFKKNSKQKPKKVVEKVCNAFGSCLVFRVV